MDSALWAEENGMRCAMSRLCILSCSVHQLASDFSSLATFCLRTFWTVCQEAVAMCGQWKMERLRFGFLRNICQHQSHVIRNISWWQRAPHTHDHTTVTIFVHHAMELKWPLSWHKKYNFKSLRPYLLNCWSFSWSGTPLLLLIRWMRPQLVMQFLITRSFQPALNFFPECQSELRLEYSFLYSLHPPCNADCPSQCDTWGLWGRM